MEVRVLHWAFQVFEDKFDGLKSKTIRVVTCHLRYVSFCCVRQNVHTSVCCNRSRNCQYQGRVYDGNSWSQWVVCDWVFTVVCFIRDNGKWSYFRSCTRCSWDGDEFSLLTKQWELEGTFTDIHEFLNQVTEVHFWLFVEEPHYFGRIHWRSTTKSDDGIWFEGTHDLCTTFNSCDIWIWFYVCKDLVNHLVATKVKLFDDTIKETKLYHSVVCNDHDTFNVTTFL